MEQTQELRVALEGVPLPLLSTEAARVLGGVNSSLDIIERAESDQPVVVLVGPTGAGKSFVFNSIVGPDASPEGVLRPTTTTIIATGRSTERVVAHAPDAEIVPDVDIGMTLVDTPGWHGDDPVIQELVSDADLVVLVVSPIRYADASVGALFDTLDPSATVIVLNRVATSGDETVDLLTSVAGVFGSEPFVITEGGEGRSTIAAHVANLIPPSRASKVASIMVRTAGAGARFIVREVTNAAPDIGRVDDAVDAMAAWTADAVLVDVQTSWEGTRDGIVERVATEIRSRDDDIVGSSGTDLAHRILETIGPWDPDDLTETLDAWHDRCISVFSDASSVRWRRANAEQLIEGFSWSTAINPEIVTPKRFVRIMGAKRDEVTRQMRSELEELVCEHVETRTAQWRSMLERYGDYRPGVLAAAADAMESQRHVRD